MGGIHLGTIHLGEVQYEIDTGNRHHPHPHHHHRHHNHRRRRHHRHYRHRHRHHQFKIATLLLKDKINEFGDEGWAKAREAFEANKHKYVEFDSEGVMLMPANTFRMTVAVKK